jgi:hypothetical protein
MQKYNLQKNPLKETKIFQDIIRTHSATNFKFQDKAKISSFKNHHIKLDLLLFLPKTLKPKSP